MDTVSNAPRAVFAQPLLPIGAARDGTAGLVLTAALELFARRGFHGTSIRDIGDAIGLTSANLYAYFESKEQLLAELVFLGHQEHHRRLRRSLMESGAEPEQQLRALVRAHVRTHAELALLSIVANSELNALSPERAGPSLALRAQSSAMIHEVIERGVERGAFDAPYVWIAAAAIGALGLRVAHWYRPGFELSLDQVCDVYAELAVRMLTRPSAPTTKKKPSKHRRKKRSQ